MESTFFRPSNVRPLGLEEVRRHWFWFLALGVFMTFLGAAALGSSFAATLVSMAFLGWLLLVGAVVEVVHAFWKRKWSGFFLDLLAGILYGGIGFLVLANPGLTALALTFMIAVLLLFGGLFRIVAALALDPPHGSWVILSGAVSMMLGLMIWHQWPISGLWAIGLFIGVDLIFNGVALMMLSFSAKRLPTTESAY
jgi:uncharacterized membrane protein HdeD (DUF308 family)